MKATDLEILNAKLGKLESIIKGCGSVAVAFSAGVDSTFLLAVCHKLLKDKCIAITAYSPSFPTREKDEAKSFCEERGIRQLTFETTEIDDKRYIANDKDRCYYCKHLLFSKMKELARSEGIHIVCEGSNMDDLSDFRPGLKALSELEIKSPLREADLKKDDIRRLSAEMNLPTHAKSSFACLATRIPYGETITRDKLSMIEKAEDVMNSLGFVQYRIRHHGDVARIEVEPKDFDKVMSERAAITEGIKEAGFSYVALDLDGYRQGKMNEKVLS